jgi:sulfoxide reductase heme-binding subunit YedZ
VAALTPLVLLIWDYTQDRLSADPIREITLRTGRYALTTLTLSLACTPVYSLLRRIGDKHLQGIRRQVMQVRRPLGLYAFLYAGLHLLTFVGLDYGFALGLVVEEIRGKRFIQIGLTAFLILVPLAITSTQGWRKRLGRRWKRLHRLAYLAALFAVLHFVWLVKADLRRPLTYGAVVVLLLVARVPWTRKRDRENSSAASHAEPST